MNLLLFHMFSFKLQAYNFPKTEFALLGSSALKAGEGRLAARTSAAVQQKYSRKCSIDIDVFGPLSIAARRYLDHGLAATAIFSSPMFIQRLPNSFLHICLKNK